MEEDQEVVPDCIFVLPDEILLRTFSFLDLEDLHLMCRVCMLFRVMCRDSSLQWGSKFLALAQIEMDKQAYPKAISLLNRLLKIEPLCSEAFKQRGLCWDHEEEPERATADFARAVELATYDAQRHRLKSYLHLAMKDYQEAFKEVNLALEMNPEEPTNYHQHAYVLFKLSSSLGRSSQEEEMQDYNRILELGYNRMAIIYNNIGYVSYERRKFNEALVDFAKSIELCKHHVRAYYNRSTVWEEMRQWENAIEDYNSILDINPSVYEAYYFRGKCYARLGDEEAAVKDSLLCLKKNVSHVRSFCFLYDLLVDGGKIEQLFEELEEHAATCREEYELLLQLNAETGVVPEIPVGSPSEKRLQNVINYGKTKRLQETEQITQMLYLIHSCRGKLKLVSGDFQGGMDDYEMMKQYSVSNLTDTFFDHCIFELDLNAVSENTVAICKRMLTSSSHKGKRSKLQRFVSQLTSSSRKRMVLSVADQMYFICCYAFRLLRLYRYGVSPDILVQFWQLIQAKEEQYRGLQYACSEPSILTGLFEAIASHYFIVSPSFLNTLEGLNNVRLQEKTPEAEDHFFRQCKQLIVMCRIAPAPGVD